MALSHNALAGRLADSLRGPQRMVWTDLIAGMSGSVRPDVFTMRCSYTQPRPHCYEVKVTASDLASDLRLGKWQNYLDFAAGVTFCFPKGMAKRGDIPKPAGVMTYCEESDHFHTLRAARLGTNRPDWDMMQKLLMDGINRVLPERRAFNAQRWLHGKRAREALGHEITEALANLHYARDERARDKRRWKHQDEQREKAAASERAALDAEKIAALEGQLIERIALAFDFNLRTTPPEFWERDLRRLIDAANPVHLKRQIEWQLRDRVREIQDTAKRLTAFHEKMLEDKKDDR